MNDTDPTGQANPDAEASNSTVTAGRSEPQEVSELARHGDPSRAAGKASAPTTAEASEKAKRGVVWVRPSELMSMASARAAGRGIDFHAELARRARAPMGQAVATSRRAISERAMRLPPVTAFGRRSSSLAGATRSGIGLR
jgi:hypothetical protein